MLFRQLIDHESCTYSYLIASGKEALIIDPVKTQVDLYLQLIKQLDLKLLMAVDTHTHADHITATGTLEKLTDCQVVMGAETKASLVSFKVKDQQIIKLSKLKIKALYTPGHTDDSYSFLVEDKVFTGDTLLIRGTGRTDFQSGSSKAQYESIFSCLLKLPKETYVYPAHDYKGQTVSTIGEEIKYNPRLQVSSPEEYIELMDNLKLPPPKLLNTAVPANLKLGC